MDLLNDYIAAVKQQLNQMRALGWFCDVSFSCNDQLFPAHRIILVPYNNLIHEMFGIDITNEDIEIHVLDPVYANIIEEVLNFIYEGPLSETNEMASAA